MRYQEKLVTKQARRQFAFACQAADGDAPHVIECCTQSKTEALRELKTLPGVDQAWLKEMTANLPD